MIHGSLFSGIGGFDLAAEWMGWTNLFHCEKNEFAQKVLNYHFPKSKSHEDITKTDFTIYQGRVDIVSGGFPCQPYSAAGKRLGKEDDRHLWPEMLRAIREIQPTWVVGENVLGLTNWNDGLVFDEVHVDLENEGYEVQSYVLPASGVNAPHQRYRIFFIAHSNEFDDKRRAGQNGGKKTEERIQERDEIRKSGEPGQVSSKVQSDVTDSNDSGANKSMRIDGERKKKNEGRKGFSQPELRKDGESTADSNGRFCDYANEEIRSRRKTSNDGSNRNATDTISGERCKGRSNEERSKEAGRHTGERSSRESWDCWEDFPLEPPVCDGNDGISSRLDGITISKWRTESIKAGGNAVVPPLILNIFKAISEYECLKRP